MKNLANCDPVEFLTQCGKIRRNAADWLEKTQVWKKLRAKADIPKDATPEEKREIIRKQTTDNINNVLMSVLEENPEDTAILLGLCCFIEPSDIRNHKISELLGSFAEVLADKDVLDFFISLMNLAQTNTST